MTDPTSPDPVASEESRIDDLADAMAALGAETKAERRAKRIVPWIASFALHGAMILVGFLLTWSAILLQPDREPTVMVADFDNIGYEPVDMLDLQQPELQEELVQDRIETDTVEQTINDQLAELERDPISMISDAAAQSPLASFAPTPTSGRAEFVGLSSSNAKRIVYVIDASGSMIRWLPIVVQELMRSLQGLTSEQSFSVIFFQHNQALVAPPGDRLLPASEAETRRVKAWIDENIVAVGESNPIEAITRALSFKPDAVFILSQNITGGRNFEVDQRDLLAMLDQLNPLDPVTDQRPCIINCIQFLDPDPLDTLRKIADIHGGPKGYKFLDRQELGLSSR